MKYLIGVDIGGTKIAGGLVYGKTVPKIIKVPTETHLGKDAIISNIIKIIKIFDNPKIHAIGLSVAGEIDSIKGTIVSSPNMPKNFKNVPLIKILKKEFQKNVYMENDGNCFTLAESVYGAGKKYKNVIGLTLGTGIGSGFCIDKKIYNGATGRATEFGHMTIAEKGFPCNCKKLGHLESYASGNGMIRLYEELTGKTKDTFYIEDRAKEKEKNALRVIHIMSDALGIGLSNIINTLNPDIIIVGGGLSRVKMLWGRSLAKSRKEVVYASLRNTKIVHSLLKEKASILGAALIAEDR